jgi:xanthine/CO dehydrogenase XdhC/CoxF family maturation factor
MSELANILHAYHNVARTGRIAALASVVNVSGSTYRRIGAHMLITEDDEVTGAISGGCLERDVRRHAIWVMQSGEAKHLVYDSTGDDDAEDAFALGCNGVVEVLVERLLPDDASMAFLASCLRRGESGVMATVFASDGSAKTGSRLLWCAGRTTLASGIDDTRFLQSLAENAHTILASGKSATRTIVHGTGRVAVCFEIIKPPPRLAIFGGGYDAVPLAAFARAVGTTVIVADPRPGYATRSRFACAERLIVAEAQAAADMLALDDNCSAVVMNHNYRLDLAALRALLPKPISYLGVLGPKRRTGRLLADLAAGGSVITQTQLARLFGPVGLDLGAETPEEVALAIVAEMKAALAGRGGGLARERKGALHERMEPLSDSMHRIGLGIREEA